MSRRAWSARSATIAVLALALAPVLAGCGSTASAARPVPTPLKVTVVPYRPAPPQLPAGHPAGALYVLDLTNRGHVAPSTLQADADAVLLHLRWSSWGGPVAVAQGTAEVRGCHPDCATGQLVDYTATIRLSDVESCDGARFYVDSSVVAQTKHGPWHLASVLRNPCAAPQP